MAFTMKADKKQATWTVTMSMEDDPVTESAAKTPEKAIKNKSVKTLKKEQQRCEKEMAEIKAKLEEKKMQQKQRKSAQETKQDANKSKSEPFKPNVGEMSSASGVAYPSLPVHAGYYPPPMLHQSSLLGPVAFTSYTPQVPLHMAAAAPPLLGGPLTHPYHPIGPMAAPLPNPKGVPFSDRTKLRNVIDFQPDKTGDHQLEAVSSLHSSSLKQTKTNPMPQKKSQKKFVAKQHEQYEKEIMSITANLEQKKLVDKQRHCGRQSKQNKERAETQTDKQEEQEEEQAKSLSDDEPISMSSLQELRKQGKAQQQKKKNKKKTQKKSSSST